MAVTHVTVAVRNPTHPRKKWEAPFLVDTGGDAFTPP